jgi:chorismate dehydratase
MHKIKLGAVGYLNARPLVHGLDRRDTNFELRFDVPSKCAALLHAGEIHVGMIPSIEYNRGRDAYQIVPDLGIISEGPVASVALFSRVTIAEIRRIGLDTSSRTSAGLTRILCREAWRIDPEFEAIPPDAAADVAGCDAALLIGDPALFRDHESAGLRRIDLGSEWTRLTGLPFVWAFWAGRPEALAPPDVETLQHARDAGVTDSDAIADAYCGPGRSALCRAYLRENIKYTLGRREIAGLQRYYDLAATHGVIPEARPVGFYASEPSVRPSAGSVIPHGS